jgi:hypothetical protein
MAQLPTPGGDAGTWGTILNDFLLVSHNGDGTLKSSALTAAGAGTYSKPSSGIPATDLSSGVQSNLTLASSAVQLGGDLGGTTTAPTIAKLQGTAVNTSSPQDNQVLSYDSTANAWVPSTITSTTISDATTSSKGIVELSGDLGGTASSPTVIGLQGNPVAAGSPSNNQVLTYSSGTGEWTATAPAVSNVAGKTGAVTLAESDITNLTTDLSNKVSASTATTKGDILAATAASTITRLGAGTDGQVLTAASGQSTGLTWTTPAVGPGNATSSTPGLMQLSGDIGGAGSSATSPEVTSTHLSSALPISQGGTGSSTQNWQGLLTPTTQTSAYTANPGDLVKANISSSSWTLKLPNAPAANTIVGAKIIANATGNINTLTVACQGSDVFEQSGGGTSVTMALPLQAAAWQYNAGYWTRVSDDLPLGQLSNLYANVFSPMAYGAAGNGTTDDTTAVQAAYAAAAAVNGVVDITGHKFLTTSPIPLSSYTTTRGGNIGSGSVPGWISNNTTDLFSVSGTVVGVAFDGGYYSASAGHVFNAGTAGCAFWTFKHVALNQSGNYCIWYMSGAGLYLDMDVGEGCTLIGYSGATTSPWYVSVNTNGANCSRWHNLRISNSNNNSVPFFHLENTAAGYADNNSFRDITAEECPAGIITALGVSHLTIDNVVGYDVTTYTGNVFNIGQGSGSGLNSRIVSIRCSGWSGGALGSGVYDVSASTTSALVLENVGPQSTGYAPNYSIPSSATTIGSGGSVAQALPSPANLGLLAWTCYPGQYGATVKHTGFAGVALFWAIWIPQACTVSNIHYGIDVAGSTMSDAFLGLYAWGSSSNALLAQCTTDQSTNMTAGANQYTAALSSSYAVPHAGMYSIGLVIGSATTMPTFISASAAQSGAFQNLGMPGYQYVAASAGSGLTALPNPSGTIATANIGLPVFVLT